MAGSTARTGVSLRCRTSAAARIEVRKAAASRPPTAGKVRTPELRIILANPKSLVKRRATLDAEQVAQIAIGVIGNSIQKLLQIDKVKIIGNNCSNFPSSIAFIALNEGIGVCNSMFGRTLSEHQELDAPLVASQVSDDGFQRERSPKNAWLCIKPKSKTDVAARQGEYLHEIEKTESPESPSISTLPTRSRTRAGPSDVRKRKCRMHAHDRLTLG